MKFVILNHERKECRNFRHSNVEFVIFSIFEQSVVET